MTNEEKEKIRQVFPNNAVIVKINPENPPTESTLSSAEWQVIMATTMLAMLPPVVIVVSMQKLFVKGLTETEK